MRIRFSRGLPVPMLYQMLYVTRPACGFDIAMTLAASRAPGVPLLYCELPISLQRVVILFCYPGRPFSVYNLRLMGFCFVLNFSLRWLISSGHSAKVNRNKAAVST